MPADQNNPAPERDLYEADVEAIIARLRPLVSGPDIIVILSNGGFGNIHERLLKEL